MSDWTLCCVVWARLLSSENAVTTIQVLPPCGAQVTCTITELSGAPPAVKKPFGCTNTFKPRVRKESVANDKQVGTSLGLVKVPKYQNIVSTSVWVSG